MQWIWKDSIMAFLLRACLAACLFLSWAPAAAGETALPFQVDFVEQQTIDGQNCIAAGFSKPLDSREDINLNLFITLKDGEPVSGGWVLAKDGCRAYFTNIEPDTSYSISIKNTIISQAGDILEEDFTCTVTTRPVEPMIRFGGQGHVLASGLSRGLPVDTVNIAQADIDFFRVRPDKIHIFRKHFTRDRRLYYHESQELKKITDLVYSGRWDLAIKKNLRTRVNIPIDHIRELGRPGLYFAVIRGAGLYDYEYSSTFFSITKIGIQVRKYQNSLACYTQSLETGKPLKKIKIQGFNAKGKEIFTGMADKAGHWQFAGDTEQIALVTASSKNDITFLPMDTPALDLSLFALGSRPFRPVEFFVYGPRNLYRPGETLVLDGLLRDYDGKMAADLPVQAQIFQPDGRMIHEFVWKGDDLGHFFYTYGLSSNALTGPWKIVFSSAGTNLGEYQFLVSDFLPERMSLTLDNPRGQADILMKDENLGIQVQGDYLYGAKAAGCQTDALLHVSPVRELFRDQWPGFVFGSYKELLNQSFSLSSISLDNQGRGTLSMDCQWEQIRSPHKISANVSLYDTGGRPVTRNRFWQVWPAKVLAGVHCGAEDGRVRENSTVDFQIITVDGTGKSVPVKGLEVSLIREYREYFWEFANNQWKWKWNSRFVPVDTMFIDSLEKGPVKVSFPVEYGGYRLDVTNPETGLVSSCEIWAGWQPEGAEKQNLNRPDRVDLTLDKQSYFPGDEVQVKVKAPEGGCGYLFVEAEGNQRTIPVKLPPEGKTVSLTLDPEWNRHDIYISALILRPGENRQAPLPKRSVGLVRLPLNRENRKLAVDIQFPPKIRPGRRVSIPVQIRTSDGKIPDQAFVTLAAVDMGILNLTRFVTPDPFDFFFQGRQYPVEIFDMYQRLISPNDGAWGKQRFGGDAPALARGGDRPATDVRIVAIHSKAVPVDASGTALFALDIPDFNGSLRLMALAYTRDCFGSGEQELTLASPLVTQLSMPRFLACGDRAELSLGMHNLTDIPQDLSLDFHAGPPLEILSGQSSAQMKKLTLGPGEKKSIPVGIQASGGLGRADLSCEIKGMKLRKPDGSLSEISLNPSWFMEVRSAWPDLTEHFRTSLGPGQSFVLPQEKLSEIMESTIGVQGEISALPPVNIASHVGQLFAYPYGCLEQVTSGLFPHVLLPGKVFARLGVDTGTDAQKQNKITIGLQKIMEKQKTNGSFSVWDANGPEDAWLTAYAGHFLVEAVQAGYDPGKTAMEKLTKRLLSYLRNPKTIRGGYYNQSREYKALVQCYASYVLARMNALTLGDVRSFYQREKHHISTPLGFVQAGIALYLSGDTARADKALEKALTASRKKDFWVGDYGSALRDDAMGFYLVASHYPGYPGLKTWPMNINEKIKTRQWFSTQERNALVMAGAALMDMKTSVWKAGILCESLDKPINDFHYPSNAVEPGGSHTQSARGCDTEEPILMEKDQAARFAFVRGRAARGLTIKNLGDEKIFLNLDLMGSPVKKPDPVSRNARMKRRILDMSGKPMGKSPYDAGQRMIVELECTGNVPLHNALAVDLLPAGMEIDDPHLHNGPDISQVMVDNKTIAQWHSQVNFRHREYRSDRFVAAFRMEKNQTKRLYYSVQAVVGGNFVNSAPLLEDMYNPSVRAIGNVGQDRISIVK